jgi:hypothetical protein
LLKFVDRFGYRSSVNSVCRVEKSGLLAVDGAIAHRSLIRAKSDALARRAKPKASVRCAAGSLSFSGQKESDGGF